MASAPLGPWPASWASAAPPEPEYLLSFTSPGAALDHRLVALLLRIAGDMALASLLDAGADLDEVTAGLSTLALRGWSIKAERTTRGGLAATRLLVQVDPKEDVVERTWATIRGLLESATGLPERARRRAQEVFGGLAVAEGSVHGVSPEEVHFHEVGGLDALIDVIGTCLALESLDVSSVFASPVALVRAPCAGARATAQPGAGRVELLAGVPVHGTSQTVELTTPTGAALLAAW